MKSTIKKVFVFIWIPMAAVVICCLISNIINASRPPKPPPKRYFFVSYVFQKGGMEGFGACEVSVPLSGMKFERLEELKKEIYKNNSNENIIVLSIFEINK